MNQTTARLLSAIIIWCALALASPSAGAEPLSRYAVVVSKATAADPAWAPVVDTLAKKHSARVLTFTNSVDAALRVLRAEFPRYICFVAMPEEVTRQFVVKVHHLARGLDDDPYTDCFWGILTGYDADAALRIARQSEPLTIRKVAGGTELAMDMVEEGVWYCELNKNKMVKKEKDGAAIELKGPDDSTAALVSLLNDYRADLFVTSGHATERDWMIGFRYKNGYFKHANGKLFGLDTQGKRLPVNSQNPKVYLPVGNCLMGHIDQADCMATAWMNSAGVCQMLGYTEPTWYGYAGWGVLDYFVEQPGRYTFTEAFFANQNALDHRLTTYYPGADEQGASPRPTAEGVAAGLKPGDLRGLQFDRDVVAFYGDPAWAARMADHPKWFDQSLEVADDTFTFTITPNRGTDSFNAVNRNGSQRGGRPFIAFLPQRICDVRIIEGAELNPVVMDDFILVPNPGECDPTTPCRVVFTGRPIR